MTWCQGVMSCVKTSCHVKLPPSYVQLFSDKDKMNNEKKNTFTFLKEFISPHMNKKKSIKSEGT